MKAVVVCCCFVFSSCSDEVCVLHMVVARELYPASLGMLTLHNKHPLVMQVCNLILSLLHSHQGQDVHKKRSVCSPYKAVCKLNYIHFGPVPLVSLVISVLFQGLK